MYIIVTRQQNNIILLAWWQDDISLFLSHFYDCVKKKMYAGFMFTNQMTFL